VANANRGLRPWTRHNKGRLGLPKPPTSGLQPPYDLGPGNRNFTFRVTKEMFDQIKAIATESGLTQGSVMRAALSDYLEALDEDSRDRL